MASIVLRLRWDRCRRVGARKCIERMRENRKKKKKKRKKRQSNQRRAVRPTRIPNVGTICRRRRFSNEVPVGGALPRQIAILFCAFWIMRMCHFASLIWTKLNQFAILSAIHFDVKITIFFASFFFFLVFSCRCAQRDSWHHSDTIYPCYCTLLSMFTHRFFFSCSSFNSVRKCVPFFLLRRHNCNWNEHRRRRSRPQHRVTQICTVRFATTTLRTI